MVDAPLNEFPSPADLVDQGWVQGALFRAPGLHLPHPSRSGDLAQHDDVFVVVSQTCDTKAAYDEEPFIECLACVTLPEDEQLPLKGNSHRRFLLNEAERLAAFGAYRGVLNKRAAREIVPLPWPSTLEQLRYFARWLGARYSRAAFPDEIIDSIVRPLQSRVDRMSKSQRRALSDALAEIRLGYAEQDNLPFHVRVELILANIDLSELQLRALDQLKEHVLQSRDDPSLAVVEHCRFREAARMSVAEYFATRRLFLDHYTYRGGEVIGSSVPPEE